MEVTRIREAIQQFAAAKVVCTARCVCVQCRCVLMCTQLYKLPLMASAKPATSAAVIPMGPRCPWGNRHYAARFLSLRWNLAACSCATSMRLRRSSRARYCVPAA